MAVRRIVLVGGGGHASDVLQAIEAVNELVPTFEVVGILDDGEVDPARFGGRGVEHIGSVDDIASLDGVFVLAVGWPATRRALAERIGERATPCEPIVHPGADVGAGVELGPGTVVLGGAHLSPMVRLGPHSLVSYNATVGHDTTFGAYASVMPLAAVSGDVVAGDDVLVGTRATIVQGLRVGDRARIGAGAAVVHDVAPDTTVVGVPARPQRTRDLDVEIRSAEPTDEDAIVALLGQTMDDGMDDEQRGPFLRWKHLENPFGPSPAWVAVADGEIVGYRAFLRWRFAGLGRTWAAVRAVDTATHPRAQGRGVFRALTLQALDALEAEGVDFVFNTPNDRSRPGYLSMGWQEVGRLAPWIAIGSPTRLARVASARVPASLSPEPTTAGTPAHLALEDVALDAARDDPQGPLRTERSAAYLRWRYGNDALGYRVTRLDDVPDGTAWFRLRRRGRALEAMIGDVLVPADDARVHRALVREVLRSTGADYAVQLGRRRPPGTVPLPGQGPVLVWRGLRADQLPRREQWDLTMGDVELL